MLLLLSAMLFQVDLPSLRVGSKAPQLQVQSWLKGEPTRIKKGQITVVDFWATWCNPCLAVLPHLGKLQTQYKNKGVAVIALAAPDNYGNNKKAVEAFVNKNPNLFTVRVGWDKETVKGYQGVFRGETAWKYLGGAKAQAIPTTFVIDQNGTVAYIGLPTAADAVIKNLINGTFNMKQATIEYAEKKSAEGSIQRYYDYIKAKDFKTAFAFGRKQSAGALRNDPRALWLMADAVVSADTPSDQRDLAFAGEAITRALHLANNQDPLMLKTFAQYLILTGDKAKAIKTLEKAISLAAGPDLKSLKKIRADMETGS